MPLGLSANQLAVPGSPPEPVRSLLARRNIRSYRGSDGIVQWDTVKPGIFERMLLQGPAVDSPTDAFALYPEMFSSVEQAKSVFRRSLFMGQIPYVYIRGMTPKSAAYRRAGRGRGWQRVWWGTADADTVQQRLDAALGDLAGWVPE